MWDPLRTPEPLLPAACAGRLVQQGPRVPGRALGLTWGFAVLAVLPRTTEPLPVPCLKPSGCSPAMGYFTILTSLETWADTFGPQDSGSQAWPTFRGLGEAQVVRGGHSLLFPTSPPVRCVAINT